MNKESVFSEYAHYYDLLYKDKDYGKEAEYIHRLIQQFRPGAASILELGSGTGKHATLFSGMGYRVHGIERSEVMLARAEALSSAWTTEARTGQRPQFTRGDIRSTRLETAKFDAVLSLFHVINYQTTNEDLLAAFRTARAHMEDSGVLVFDMWYGPAVLTDKPSARHKCMSDDKIEVTRRANPVMHANENIVDVNYHVVIKNKLTGQTSETRETHCMRYLFLPEVDYLLGHAGFTRRHAEEWMTGKPANFNTWGITIIAQPHS